MGDNKGYQNIKGKQEALNFKSLFETLDSSSPPETELWKKVTKGFNWNQFGSVLYSSKLYKKSKQTTFHISRYYFLFKDHIAYSSSKDPANIKKYIEIKGLKLRLGTQKSKSDKIKKYSFTFYRSNISFTLLTKDKSIYNEWRENLTKSCVLLDFNEHYKTKHVIGKGASGKVLLAEHIEQKTQHAIKVFDKAELLKRFNGCQYLFKEIEMLRLVDHPDLIKLNAVYESDTDISLVLEYIDGGDLYTRIRRKGCFNEKNTIKLLQNLLEALMYLDSKGLVHRDLKPANIVLCSTKSDTDIKVIDFGYAIDLKSNKDLNIRCGTPGYVAPEMLGPSSTFKLTTKADVFSLGCIIYQVIMGSRLFRGSTNSEVLVANRRGAIDISKLREKKVSSQTIDLLLKMLERDPLKRISAKDALEHSLFTNYIPSSAEILDDFEEILVEKTTRYSFDVGMLKENYTTYISHSKLLDTIGTFYMAPHISIEALDSTQKLMRRRTQTRHHTSSFHYGESQNTSRNKSRVNSPDSWEDSEEEDHHPKGTPSNRSRHINRLASLSIGHSPIHRTAILNNIRKQTLIGEERSELVEDHTSRDFKLSFFKSIEDTASGRPVHRQSFS